MLVEFASVVDAVRCAVEVQRAMIDPNAEIPEDKRITFRIGVNLGDVIIDGDDIYGDGVNIAARLEALAEPGGICISRVVRDQIRDKLSYPFEGMGEQSVKNIARPVRAYAMSAATVASTPLVAVPASPDRARSLRRFIIPASAIAGLCISVATWWVWPKGTPPAVPTQTPVAAGAPSPAVAETKPAPRLSIVVLPFANLSNDPEQEYFADGVTDDLTTDLSRISGSFVIARNTAFTYKGKPTDVKQIGRDLGVHYVIEGSVRRTGETVDVNVQLIDAESGAHVWADRFGASRANLPAAQNHITGRLAQTLNSKLLQAGASRIEAEGAVNPDARDLVIRGWVVHDRPYSIANRQEARRLFERALALDPRSVDAKTGLARVLVANVAEGWSNSIEQDKSRAEQLLLEAVELDPNRSSVHYVIGLLRRVQNRSEEARTEFETTIALDRNNARAYFQLGLALTTLGRPDEAIPNIEKAMRLNPLDPNRSSFDWALGDCYLLTGQVDPAIALLRKARSASPNIFYFHLSLAGALGFKGDLVDARAELEEAIRLKPEINSLARFHALYPSLSDPRYLAFSEKTMNLGLRQAGFPEE
jgi:adenylate cyclase